MEGENTASCDPHYRPPSAASKAWKAVKWHAYLLCLRLFYRHTMRLLHRFGVHRMKYLHPMGGPAFYRCDWCGMHGTRVEPRDYMMAWLCHVKPETTEG